MSHLLSAAKAGCVAAALTIAGPSQGASRKPAHPLTWTELGTQGGPDVNAQRSQPSHVMMTDGKPWLIDCGDGCLERLARAGHSALQLKVAFISHLHMDHIAGLQGLIGLRWMQGATDVLTIYGPPETDRVVDSLLQSLQRTYHIGDGVGSTTAPEKLVKVVILKQGADLTIDGVRVRTARNTHFDDSPGHPLDNGTQSLSYRFDKGGYAIGYTGDTGPSQAVAQLENGVDLLVSEVIDLPSILSTLKAAHPGIEKKTYAMLVQHLKTQHVKPEDAGKIAQAAHAKRLVFTHLSISGTADAVAEKLIFGAHKTYEGNVHVAHDLETF